MYIEQQFVNGPSPCSWDFLLSVHGVGAILTNSIQLCVNQIVILRMLTHTDGDLNLWLYEHALIYIDRSLTNSATQMATTSTKFFMDTFFQIK